MTSVIDIEIFNKLFSSIAEEMGIILAKSSFSPNIKERRDFSCALFDSKGELLAQAAHIPVHLGSMPLTLRYVLEQKTLRPGEIIIVNDPFHGGSHLPDITLVEGVFPEGSDPDGCQAQFYVVNRAHHADIGGKLPGSMGLLHSIHDEGILIPPTTLYRGNQMNDDFLVPFLSSMRNPAERKGDLQAQIASLKRGRERLLELVSQYGLKKITTVSEQLKEYAERLMRDCIKNIPDGSYTFSDFLDNDAPAQQQIRISVKLDIRDEQVIADFRESSDQLSSPLNTVYSVVVSATTYAFQCLLGDTYPVNHGSYRPITILTRQGSLLSATSPAAVAAGNVETSQRLVDVLYGALAQALPSVIPAASCGTMNNIAIGSTDTSATYSYYETIAGGMGARPSADGLDCIQTHMTNTMNTPIEALERSYPFIIESYKSRKDSGGKGIYSGGNGIVRSYHFLNDARVSLLTERRKSSPYGLAGGKEGKRGRNILRRKKKRTVLPGKINLQVKAGDLLHICTPGGGGWGSHPAHSE
jgi:N-methylhydantoinase B